MRLNHTRRAVMKGATILGINGVTGLMTTQEDEETIELEGHTSGWEGVSPEYLEDELNPTLYLETGEEYTVIWENMDSLAHNFAIEGADIETELITEGTQTVEFEATDQMTDYYCQPHPEAMRGEIVLDEEPEVEEEEEEIRDFDEPTDEPDGDPVEVFEFILEGEWEGISPAEVEGEHNPMLTLEEGEIYGIEFSVETGRAEHHPGHYLVIFDDGGLATARTDFVRDGESELLKFEAESGLVGYRDQAQQNAEGDIEIE